MSLAILAAVAALRTKSLVAVGMPVRDATIAGDHTAYGVVAGCLVLGLVVGAVLIRRDPRGRMGRAGATQLAE